MRWDRRPVLLIFLVALLAPFAPHAMGQEKVEGAKPATSKTTREEVPDELFQQAKRFLLGQKIATEERIERAVKARGRAAVVRFARSRGWRGGAREAAPGPARPVRLAARPSLSLTPLCDLVGGRYKGEPGGLYPGGRNTPPPTLLQAALGMAAQIKPLDEKGQPSPDGKIVMISNGMSNTTQEFSVFAAMEEKDPERNPRLVIVDCAQGGMEASMWADPTEAIQRGRHSPWEVQGQRLEAAGVAADQVQVVWVKQARARPASLGEFPDHARALEQDLAAVLRELKRRFPNLRLAYLSSRIYAGYASTPLNPEPYAYESAFSVRWLIERQMKGDPALNFDPARGEVNAPLLLWGPYLWADGVKGRKIDRLLWTREDLGGDGTHPSDAGRRKVAERLLRFFKTDPTAKSWFTKPASG